MVVVTLKEIESRLEELASDGVILKYDFIEDSGEKVVLNILYLKDSDEYESKNFILFIKDRGSNAENVFWYGKKFDKLLKMTNSSNKLDKTLRQAIVKDLKDNYRMILLDYFNYDAKKKVVRLGAYCKSGDGLANYKDFIVKLKIETGTFEIYEIE